MKKLILTFFLLTGLWTLSFGQKYAFVDTEYILNNIPSYKSAQSQLDKISQQYQKELETMHADLDKMYQNFQSESVLLSNDMKRRREEVIVSKEKDYKKLQKTVFRAGR